MSNLGEYDTILEWASHNQNTVTTYVSDSKVYPDLLKEMAWGFIWTVGKNIYSTGGKVFATNHNSNEIYVRSFSGDGSESSPFYWSTEWQYLITNGMVSNPNMLINPDFSSSINQRMQTVYSGAGIYTIDRWQLTNQGALTINDGFISVFLSSTSTSFAQKFTSEELSIKGKTVTLSACITSNDNSQLGLFIQTLKNGTQRNLYVKWIEVSENEQIVSVTGIISDDVDRINLYIKLANAATVTTANFGIKWAKLELGAVATQFIPPNLADELAKCQRYYQEITGYYPVSIYTDDLLAFHAEQKSKMRVTPTVKFKNNNINTLDGVAIIDILGIPQAGFSFNVRVDEPYTKLIAIRAGKVSHGFNKSNCSLIITDGNTLCLDAEVY